LCLFPNWLHASNDLTLFCYLDSLAFFYNHAEHFVDTLYKLIDLKRYHYFLLVL